MKNPLYFDFSTKFGKNISAVLAKNNTISKHKSYQKKVQYFGNNFNLDFENIGIPLQTHSNNCKIIDSFGVFPNTDGLITQNNNIVLSLSVADCCPIFIYDNKLKSRGLVHSGWKGTVDKICNQAIEKFLDLDSKILDLKVFLGPSIGRCCYKVGKEIADMFDDKCKIIKTNGVYFVDIREQIKLDLIESGLKKNQINISSICTFESDECESYRRDSENSGRMIALFGNLKI